MVRCFNAMPGYAMMPPYQSHGSVSMMSSISGLVAIALYLLASGMLAACGSSDSDSIVGPPI